jgi:hypothetical protein
MYHLAYAEVTVYDKFQLIKTNVFFLCHWTKNFQKNIASKLVRQVYSPNEVLSQLSGKEKLYILSRGKIDVEADFFSQERLLSRKKLAFLRVDSYK